MKLTSEVVKFLEESHETQGILADKMGKHPDTIRRWIRLNHAMLTTPVALLIIRDATKLVDEQILEPLTQKVA